MALPSESVSPSRQAPRGRAIVVGVVLAVFIGIALPYNELIIKGSRLGLSSCTPAAFFLLFVWLLLVNPLLRVLRRSWALRRSELLVVFAMTMVATAIPTRGVTSVMLPMISGAHYYAAPENQWGRLVLPHMPDWLVVSGQEGLRQFYEGMPRGASPVWHIWVMPLAYWFLFLGGLWLAVVCLMAILRRQWVERERLTFPVMHVPLAMVEKADDHWVPPFFRNRLMWFGFGVPFLFGTLSALHHYFPGFPAPFEQMPSLRLMGGAIHIPVRLNLLMLGFAYLVDARVSLSLWFFYIARVVIEGFLSTVGVGSAREQLGYWTYPGRIGHIFTHQSMGAMIALVAFSIWASREHLRDVFRQAIRPRDDDPTREMIGYRWAVLGLACGWGIMTGWLWRAGLPWWIAPLVVAAAFVIFISMTRAIVEGGVATIVPAMIPCGFTLSAFGTDALGIPGLVAMGFSLVWCGDLLTFMMAPTAHAARVASDLKAGRNRIFVGILLAMGVSLVVSVVFTIVLALQHGAGNLHSQYFQQFARFPAEIATMKIRNPTGPSGVGWMWTGVGAAVMSLLTLASYRWAWWPLGGIGYVVSPAWIMGSLWFPFFVASIGKSAVLKFGGIDVYRRSRWFIYGMILGQIVVAGVWLLIDIGTGTTGNRIRVY